LPAATGADPGPVAEAGVAAAALQNGSERIVYLADGLLELLSEHIAQHRPGDDATRWLFGATSGLPPRQNTVGHQWRKACRSAELTDLTLLSRPGARCRHYCRSVSPGRSPNPPCQFPGSGLPTACAVRRGSRVAMGFGSCSAAVF